MDRPTGTVTFLFTDVEGSTRLWEEHPGEMKGALARHDDLMRQTIEGAGGYIFTTAGDAFSAAFQEPTSAAEAALGCQLRLGAEDWPVPGGIRVRMALHTGGANERGGDYFGPALNRTARILSTGHGGQVLVSLATEELLKDRLEPGGFRDLGEHTLKDLSRPEHIFQLTHPDLSEDFPEIRSLGSLPNNLPTQLTSFVGREKELDDVVELLARSRLVTLTGVGGSGKTRLAIQAAAESIDDFPHGAFLVELASIADAGILPNAIAETLGVLGVSSGGANPAGDAKTVVEQLVRFLERRTLLLVLDNCEHVIEATAEVVGDLMSNCPDLSILATSREGLGLTGENLWQVPSLDQSEADPNELTDAVLLFAERAKAVKPGFALDEDTLPAARQICERLDGMPLAIELAAARAKVLTAGQIAERLDDRFRLLTGGSRDALPRHQTLQAAVDWSYELLTNDEKSLFGRLAAFRGGFDLEATEEVAADNNLDRYDVLDLLTQLVDKSIVVSDAAAERFNMLETLRQYALVRLSESHEVEAVRLRHAEYFRHLCAEAADHEHGPDEGEWYDRLDADADNIRAALTFYFDNGYEKRGVELASSLGWYWWIRSKHAEGRDIMKVAREHINLVEPVVATWLLAQYSILHSSSADRATQMALAKEAEGVAVTSEEPLSMVHAHFSVAWAHQYSAELDEFRARSEVLLELAEQIGAPWFVAVAHYFLALDLRFRGEPEGAERRLETAMEHLRELGDEIALGACLNMAGILARYRLDFEKELRLQREARDIARAMRDRGAEGYTLMCEAVSLRHLNRYDEAAAALEEALIVDSSYGPLGLAKWARGALADARYVAGEREAALETFGEAFHHLADPLDSREVIQNLSYLLLILVDESRFEPAARVLGYTTVRREKATMPVPPPSRAEHAELERKTKEALGDRYDGEYLVGAGMSDRDAADMGRQLVAELMT